jgi:FemAB-related protein (PEP-CTERM system-associated)
MDTTVGPRLNAVLSLGEGRDDASSASVSDVAVTDLRVGEDAEWDDFVKSSPSGTVFHLTSWRKTVERALGRQCFSLVARRGNRITGVFPISRAVSRLFGDSMVSMPLAVYGGICAEDRDSHDALLQAAGGLARRLGVQYIEIRNREESFPTSLPGRDLYVRFTQDLTPGPEKLLQQMPRDTRYAIRKSMKAGLEWTEDLELAEFYDIYAESVHRLGTPVFSKSLFECLQAEFSGQWRLFGVRKGKRAIAGVFCLYFKDQVLPYYAGALAEFYKDSPNNFMYWSLIAQSCAEGLRTFDFGRSKRGTGAFQFKSAWNMQVEQLPYRYLLNHAKEVPQMSPLDKKFRLPVEVWKRLPFGLTKVIGPPLVRRIPSI